eukprot:CAMPEP_0184515868 /NCGR_PEP_ID=MMETSP0198_2-20121128/4724_1 /TAXON_ID=1112570 /ORGANISM="Thraustochytrium sp., Strain LLF1b" /LENGTH=32 /DNA_ID= /DNA_START= /DNA_END= /DNA_ORIENTATION=
MALPRMLAQHVALLFTLLDCCVGGPAQPVVEV